jgi:hypothetical protein
MCCPFRGDIRSLCLMARAALRAGATDLFSRACRQLPHDHMRGLLQEAAVVDSPSGVEAILRWHAPTLCDQRRLWRTVGFYGAVDIARYLLNLERCVSPDAARWTKARTESRWLENAARMDRRRVADLVWEAAPDPPISGVAA